MAVTGAKFLRLTKARTFTVTTRAMTRLGERSGRRITREEAFRLFCRGIHLRAEEAFLLGYRPGYAGRLQQGQKSWYFRLDLDGEELIAVLGEALFERELVWVTTYAPNQQTAQYRLATHDELTLSAALN